MIKQKFNNMNITKNIGALPDVLLRQLIDEKMIVTDSGHLRVNPSSFDLVINPESIVKIPYAFTPSKKRMSISETLQRMDAVPVRKENGGYLLERGSVYVARILDKITLPKDMFARINPKSSTGRSDLHVQLMGDLIPKYDRIPKGWSGELYVLIRAKSFPIFFPEGECISLNQLRVFKHNLGILDTNELRDLTEEKRILLNEKKQTFLMFNNTIEDSQIELSLDLRDWGTGDSLGFVAKQNVSEPLIWKKGANDKNDFFEAIPKIHDDRTFRLEKDRFYILSSRESVMIPKEYACEMVSFDDTRGEMRAHYAGFIDNGWGEKGHRPLTLEVRAFEHTLVYHGQPIASVILHRMYAPVNKGYDDIATSNYTDQDTAKLGKFFK